MKFRGIKKVSGQSKFELLHARSAVDGTKLEYHSSDLHQAVENYFHFQSHNHYRWPLWLMQATNEFSRNFTPITPFFLQNNFQTDYLQFSNFLSSRCIKIDPTGMVCASKSCWSMETWVLVRDELFRPQDTPEAVIQKRDETSGIISTVWKHPLFTITTELFGTRTTIDEAILQLQCDIPGGTKHHLTVILAIRPYTIHSIGGINTIEYKSSAKLVRINKSEAIHINMPAKEIFLGNSQIGDINFSSSGDKIQCPGGMATMALAFPVKKSSLELNVRFSLSENKTIEPLNLNYDNIKKDFRAYIDHMKERGMQIQVPDKQIARWFNISKLKALESLSKTIYEIKKDKANSEIGVWPRANLLLMALLRMGYEDESRKISDAWLHASMVSKEPTFFEIIKHCYCISSFAEYFTITRDTEYLSQNMEKVKNIASAVLSFLQKNKSFKKSFPAHNSIYGFLVPTFHIFDIIIIAHAMSQYSYLCRTMGLFGQENTYLNESKKLKEMVVSYINDVVRNNHDVNPCGTIALDEYAAYITLCNYPYFIDSIPNDSLSNYFLLLEKFYKKYPIFIHSSGGWDVFLSIMMANNLLLQNNPSGLDIVNFFLKVAGSRYALPGIMHPVSLKGISSCGDSDSVNSAVFLFLRNSFFHDKQDRLELFPVPRDDWFKPKTEIEIINAPSRFGKINFKVVNTENEIQVFFSDLPKYIPPDILIRLPFEADIKPAEDFVLKKEFGSSFIINGWPSVLQFTRK